MNSDFQLLLLVHSFATWAMVGVIWFVQVVHYPLYKKIKEGFQSYERMHLKRTSLLLSPILIIEMVTAFFLIGIAPSGLILQLAAYNLILLILIWITTLLFQISQHQKLAIRFSTHQHKLLLLTNWIRVILWTVRGLIVAAMLFELFGTKN
ncbi:MAG: hypothetical protein SNF33_08165 [Candidatus Algichlamydia australiensis]|nr:hypothetical protein [Chlamydiales bacterium]